MGYKEGRGRMEGEGVGEERRQDIQFKASLFRALTVRSWTIIWRGDCAKAGKSKAVTIKSLI
jgi:hypothetical protein